VSGEQRFLAWPEDFVGGMAWAALEQIGAMLDLDFVGIDFSVLNDGRLLLFGSKRHHARPSARRSALFLQEFRGSKHSRRVRSHDRAKARPGLKIPLRP
jgi:hypothetical protein